MILAALALVCAQDPLVSWRLEPTEVELGQPITCRLEVPHAPGAAPLLPELQLDYGWEVVSGPESRPMEGGTRLSWTLLALEPGARELPGLDLDLGDGSRLACGSGSVQVRAALAPEEDEPRPMPGFRTVGERTSVVRPRHLLFGGLTTLLLSALSLIAWRRSRRARPEDEPTELERFEGLDRGQARPVAIGLAGLLRSAAERRSGVDPPRVAMTDEEWLASLDADDQLDGDTRAELGAVLVACADIKFAGGRPTPFAVDELLGRGEALLRSLADSADSGEEVAP